MSLPFNRQSFLIGTAVLSLFLILAHQFLFSTSGITIHEKKVPLSKVLAQLKKKGGIPVHSNIDPNTLVTVDVENVPLAEAMEVLSIELDARWMPYYALAPDKAKLSEVLGGMESASGKEGVRTFYRPLPGPVGWAAGDYLPDPKKLNWVTDSVTGKKNLEEVLTAMAEGSEAGFAAPKDWNPDLAQLPTKELLGKAVDQVADAAKAKEYPFLYIYQRQANPGQGGPPGDRPQFGGGAGRQPQNEELLEKRVNLRLAALPPEEREEAKVEWTKQKEQWKEMQNLTPEERRAKMRELMDDPAAQDKMEERAAKRDGRSTPEKRRERYKKYAERKAQFKGTN